MGLHLLNFSHPSVSHRARLTKLRAQWAPDDIFRTEWCASRQERLTLALAASVSSGVGTTLGGMIELLINNPEMN